MRHCRLRRHLQPREAQLEEERGAQIDQIRGLTPVQGRTHRANCFSRLGFQVGAEGLESAGRFDGIQSPPERGALFHNRAAVHQQLCSPPWLLVSFGAVMPALFRGTQCWAVGVHALAQHKCGERTVGANLLMEPLNELRLAFALANWCLP